MIDYSEGSGKQYHTGVGKGDVGRYPSLEVSTINLQEHIFDKIIQVQY